MTPDRHKSIKSIFLQVIESPQGEWDRQLAELCGADANLKREVSLLLACHVDIADAHATTPELSDRKEPGEAGRGPGEGPHGSVWAGGGAVGGEQSLPARRNQQPAAAQGGNEFETGALPMPTPRQADLKSTGRLPDVGRADPSRSGGDADHGQGDRASGRRRPRSSLLIEQGRFLPGVLIAGRYRIVAMLGRGGMGEVYRADDLKLGQAVALKFLPTNLASDRQRMQHFVDEVRTARAVSHPNVCRVYDLEEHAGEPFMAMEYIDGETLDSLISRIGVLPEKKATQLAQQLCAGLAAIHAEGILHRDLKPANIMIDGRGQVRVTDFGLATAREIAGLEAVAGTPGFVAPEALTGGTITERSDVYTLGLVLYELFTGVPAYRGKSRQELVRLQQTIDPDPPGRHAPELSSEVERAISACLERNPDRRPASVRDVSALLPGRDPLVAALAAGETPSPEMVAASGRHGLLRPWEAMLAVGLYAMLMLGGMYLGQWGSLLQRVTIRKSPEVLAERARSVLEQLGYTPDPSGGIYSFDWYDEFMSELNARDKSAQRLVRLSRVRPAPIDFWYRQGGKLVPFSDDGVVTFDDPPLAERGMIVVRLTPAGQLRELDVLNKDLYWPKDGIGPSPPAPETEKREPDWTAMFNAAGLDIRQFAKVEPRRIPPVYADSRFAWSGTYPESPDEPVQIEAAALGGKVVAFRSVEINWQASQVASRPVTLLTRAQEAGLGLLAVVQVASVFGAVILARQNLRDRRGDRAGAFKIAMVISLLTLAAALLRADTLASNLGYFGNIPMILAQAVAYGLMAWVLYLGIEPYVRRTWPEVLVSWTRLLEGRARDPLVGQSVLAGAIIGCLCVCLVFVNRALPEWLGKTPTIPFFLPEFGTLPLGGLGENVAAFALIIVKSVQVAMGFVAVITIIRIGVKRPLLTLFIFGVLQTTIWVLRPDALTGWWSPLLVAAMIVPALMVFVRYGLLALIVTTLVFHALVVMPLTLDAGAWFYGRSVTTLLVVSALVVYAASCATVGLPNRQGTMSGGGARR